MLSSFHTENVLQEARWAHERGRQALDGYLRKKHAELARVALAELGRLDLAESFTRAFLGQLHALAPDQKSLLQLAEQPLLLQSPLALDPVQKAALHKAITELVGRSCELHFEVTCHPASSLELYSRGRCLAIVTGLYLDF